MAWQFTASVTTCSRVNGGYLEECLASIRAAGWPDIAIHNDPEFKRGPWGNLQDSIHAAAALDPDAALFVQDDTLIAAHAREYLEAVLPEQPWWPKLGILSLYVNQATSEKMSPGFHVIDPRRMGRHGGGACAFILPRASLRLMCQNMPWPQAWHLAEIWLQCWTSHPNVARHWVDHVPSLAKHVGKVSALKKIPNESQPRPEPPWTEWRHESDWVADCRDYLSQIVDGAKPEPSKAVVTTLF